MSRRGIVRTSLAIAALGIAGLAAYEGYALWRAEARTPQILAAYLAKPQPVALAALTPDRKEILLKVEDPGFYQHKGIDWSSPGQGMTTITQALTKFLYFKRFRKGFAKIEQSLIARFVLDRHLTKDQQLALYINQAYLGEIDGKPIRGFEAASLAYFDKPFAEINSEEYLGLVGMLISPNALRPDKHPDAYKERVARIENLVAGNCKPTGVLDALFAACAPREIH